MCTGRCSRLVAGALYPLALISIICNIILFFPDWQVTYARDGYITEEVKYMGGLVGGGLMRVEFGHFVNSLELKRRFCNTARKPAPVQSFISSFSLCSCIT
ncbi:transmembrane 4 L6 family member 5 [Tachysurus ichikawai]